MEIWRGHLPWLPLPAPHSAHAGHPAHAHEPKAAPFCLLTLGCRGVGGVVLPRALRAPKAPATRAVVARAMETEDAKMRQAEARWDAQVRLCFSLHVPVAAVSLRATLLDGGTALSPNLAVDVVGGQPGQDPAVTTPVSNSSKHGLMGAQSIRALSGER